MHLIGKWFMFLQDPSVEASVEIIGSNTSLVANFGSTLDEAYVRFFGNDPNSNIGFSLGCSNADSVTPIFVIGETSSNPSGIASDFVIRNHQIGIGTDTPSSTLDVTGDIRISGNMYQGADLLQMWSRQQSDIYFTGGNVGVGTTNATSTLTVNGSISATNLAPSAFTDTTNATNITSGTISSNLLQVTGTPNGTFGSANLIPRITVDTKGRILFIENVIASNVDAENVDGLALVATTGDYNSLSNITFYLNNGNAVYTSGSVGIGTLTPSTRLHVDGTITASAFSGNLNATNITSGTLANEHLPTALSVSATSQAIRIDSNGNAGIGTATPSVRLHVEGDMYANGTLTAKDLVIFGDTTVLNTVSSNTEQMIITNAGTGPALKVIQSGINTIAEFYDSDVSGTLPSMMIANGGNVGIGTATPLKTLHVQGDVNFTGALYQNNTLYVSSQWTSGTGNDLYYNLGNIGIGTSSPLSKLHVNGTVSASNFSGEGASLSNLNASFISSGTLINARLPSAISQTTLTASSSVSTPVVTTSGTAIDVSGKSLSNILNVTLTGSLLQGSTEIVATNGIINSNALPVSGVSANTYGTASSVPVFTVDNKGRVLSVTNTAISIAGNAVTGLATSAFTDATNATNITSGTLDANRLAVSGVSAATYGNASNVSRITVDTKGRVTSASAVSIQIPSSAVTGLATVATSGDYNSLSNITFTKSGSNAIFTSGNVGIGTSSPLYVLHTEGDTYLSHLYTTEVTMTSDRNLKTNVETIQDPMSLVRQLRGVHFDWMAKDSHSHLRRSMGLIAQEVESVLPQLVREDAYGHKSISYGNMIGLLVEALKQQDQRIVALEERLRAESAYEAHQK